MVREAGWNRMVGSGLVALVVGVAVAACGTVPPEGERAPAAAPAVAGVEGVRSADRRPVALFAEGAGDPAWVLPPGMVPPLPPGVEFRARYTYPAADDDDLLELQVFFTGVGAPVGLPIAPEYLVSRLLVKVDRFQVSRTPEPNLLLTGTVKSTPKASPFGETVGRLLAVSAGFTEGETTTFHQMGGPVAGSHVTVLPVATGSIRFGKEH